MASGLLRFARPLVIDLVVSAMLPERLPVCL